MSLIELAESSNLQYHANRTHLSSSNLKQILTDPETFHREWVLGQKETREEKPQFAEGSYVHSLMLEPDKVAAQYAIYDGLRKAGDRYQEFAAANAGRTIMSVAQVARCNKFYQAYQARPEAMRMLSGGIAEHTMVSQVLGVPVKARADYINVELGYITDVKTTAYPTGPDVFQQTMREFKYDLSAALYCQIAHDVYGKLFDFYFVVISKSDLDCQIYKASSDTLTVGAAMVTQAVVLYKKCLNSGIWTLDQPKPVFDTREYEILEV